MCVSCAFVCLCACQCGCGVCGFVCVCVAGKPVNSLFVSPAVTPIKSVSEPYSNNPGFRMYLYQPQDYTLLVSRQADKQQLLSNCLSLSLSLSLSLLHTHSPTPTHSYTHSLTHTHTHTHRHSLLNTHTRKHTPSHTHTDTIVQSSALIPFCLVSSESATQLETSLSAPLFLLSLLSPAPQDS